MIPNNAFYFPGDDAHQGNAAPSVKTAQVIFWRHRVWRGKVCIHQIA